MHLPLHRSIYLVVEYAEKGDLRQNMFVTLTERRARDFLAVPILGALTLLHKEVSGDTLHPDRGR